MCIPIVLSVTRQKVHIQNKKCKLNLHIDQKSLNFWQHLPIDHAKT